jgi:hypothetical protein
LAYRKGSVDRMLRDEYCVMQPDEWPRYGTPEWRKWLDDFSSRHPLEVSRAPEPLAERAVKILRHSIPDFD